MKSLAILQDSFREAVDSKVFSVMVVLSILLALGIGSVSFEPLPVAQMPSTIEGSLNSDVARQDPTGERLPLSFKVIAGEPQSGHPDEPASPCCFTLRAQFRSEEAAGRARGSPGSIQDYLADHFGWMGGWQVLAVTSVGLAGAENRYVPSPPGAKEAYFEVNTRATEFTLRAWPHHSTALFGSVPLSATMMSLPAVTELQVREVPALGFQVWIIEDYLVGGFGAWVAILVSVVITAFFIPNMLRKGSVDLLLVKPLHRPTLLIYKYLGGLLFIFFNTAVAVGGVWLALGLRSGLWSPHFLVIIVVITFFFAILYAVSALVAVFTRSVVVSILLTLLVWAVLYAVGRGYYEVEEWRRTGKLPPVAKGSAEAQPWWSSAISGAHFLLPRTKDLDYLTTRLLTSDLLPPHVLREMPEHSGAFNWGESLTVSGLFIAVMLGLASWRFATGDY